MRRSQKRKKDNQVVSLFALLGSAPVKAASKMLMKLTPAVNFKNNLQAHFSYKTFCTDFL